MTDQTAATPSYGTVPAKNFVPTTFYSRFQGTKIQMGNKKDEPAGKMLVFLGCEYITQNQDETDFLNEVIERASGDMVISRIPVPVKQNDALILRDVSTSAVSSQSVRAMAALSNSR